MQISNLNSIKVLDDETNKRLIKRDENPTVQDSDSEEDPVVTDVVEMDLPIRKVSYICCYLTHKFSAIDQLKPILKLRESPTRPPKPQPNQGQTFSQTNHVQSSSNFHDIFLIIYEDDIVCQR